MPPTWLQITAWVSLVTAFACAIVIVVDIRARRFRQPMGVMEWVWPITALYLGPFGLAFYWQVGRTASPRWVVVYRDDLRLRRPLVRSRGRRRLVRSGALH